MCSLAKTLVTDLTYKSSDFLFVGSLKLTVVFDLKREFVLETKLNNLPKDVFFGRFRPQTTKPKLF